MDTNITNGSIYYPGEIEDNLTWWDSARIPASSDGYDTFEEISGTSSNKTFVMKVHNGGDVEAPFIMEFSGFGNGNDLTIELYEEDPSTSAATPIRTLELNNFGHLTANSAVGSELIDTAIRINGYNMLIEGLVEINDVLVPSGTIYNRAISSGEIFKIPVINSSIDFTDPNTEVDFAAQRDFWFKVTWLSRGLVPSNSLLPWVELYPGANLAPTVSESTIEYYYWYV